MEYGIRLPDLKKCPSMENKIIRIPVDKLIITNNLKPVKI
jgi:hypothetical protein